MSAVGEKRRPKSPPPQFLGIGAQKCGTTWLWANLRLHPDIWLPPAKEIHYFDVLASRERPLSERLVGRTPASLHLRRTFRRAVGESLTAPGTADLAWYLRYCFGGSGEAWYRSLFAPAGSRLSGDITPGYSRLDDQAVGHVKAMLPDARLILMIRHPVERAWSQAVLKERKQKRRTSVEAALEHVETPESRRRTEYLGIIRRWKAHYPRHRLFVGFLDDVHYHPDAFLQAVLRFLGVDPEAMPDPIRTRVFTRSPETMPTDVAMALASQYQNLSHRLARRLGGHAVTWAEGIDRLLADPPRTTRIPYPFWEPTESPVAMSSGTLNEVAGRARHARQA